MDFMDENENIFKRQRIKSAWKLRRAWEVERRAYMFQKNENDHEINCTINHPIASKRKRESTEPYIPSEPIPSQQQNGMMNDTNTVFLDPVLFDSENVDMDIQPNLIDSFQRSKNLSRESPLFSVQLALKHLLSQIELSIQQQEVSINNQRITIQQLGKTIQNFERLLNEIY